MGEGLLSHRFQERLIQQEIMARDQDAILLAGSEGVRCGRAGHDDLAGCLQQVIYSIGKRPRPSRIQGGQPIKDHEGRLVLG